VRRSALDDDTKQRLHKAAVKHWEEVAETAEDQIILLYHRIASLEESVDAQLEVEMERLLETHSGAFSVLLEQAINVSTMPSQLHYMAGKVAIERCEPDHVRRHLEALSESPESRHLSLGLAMLEGRIQDADDIIEQGLAEGDESEKNRMALAAASRRLDDRVFDQQDSSLAPEVKAYLQKVKIPKQSSDERSVTLIALSMIQHALAVWEKEFEKAKRLRSSLAAIGGFAQPLLQGLEAKANLAAAQSMEQRTVAINEIQTAIQAQTNSIRAEALRLSLVEQFIDVDQLKAKQMFSMISEPSQSANSATLHRLHARWWTCKARLQPNMRRIALREAITQHRAAGCPRAAKALEAQLHSLL
jgi:hypothetical protein